MDIPEITDVELSEKEKKILQSAIKVFSEKGFSASTTNEIAKGAGVAEGTIFRYFKTKKDLLRGILLQVIKIMSKSIVISPIEKILKNEHNKDLKTVLKKILYDRIKLVDQFFPMITVIITEAFYHEEIRNTIYQNIIVTAADTFKDYYQKLVDNNMIRSDIGQDVLLRMMIGNIFAFIAQRKFYPDKFSSNDIEKNVDQMLELVLYGITPPIN